MFVMKDMPRLLAISAFWIAVMIIVHIIYRKFRKPGHNLHIRFLDHTVRLVIYIFCVANIIGLFNPGINISQVLLRGSALIVAIVGLAAQPVIADLICGFLISINKPFEIGDRIIVEGQEPGIVEDITLRHVVLRIYDDFRIIVPNSQLNNKVITNTSYRQKKRGVHLQYCVSYDTDITRAMDIIRDCVAESPYTLSVESHGITEDSGPVYFLRYTESAVVLETTIHVLPSVSTYIATTDVNQRVHKAFRKQGIEIPYSYVNVIKRKPGEEKKISAAESTGKEGASKSPSKRNYRTDTVKLYGSQDPVITATSIAMKFAEKQRLTQAESYHLQLMSEEMIVMLHDILAESKSTFYIEGSGQSYRIRLQIPVNVDAKWYHTLLSLSSSGKNDAAKDIGSKIRETIITGIDRLKNTDSADNSEFNWAIDEMDEDKMEAMSKSILTTYADDIRVSIKKDKAEVILVKGIS